MFHEQNIELTIYRDDIMTAHEPDYAITCDHETCLVKSYFPEFTDVRHPNWDLIDGHLVEISSNTTYNA